MIFIFINSIVESSFFGNMTKTLYLCSQKNEIALNY